ncbi:MAG TPA: M20/M25/M40 family metallo-hydrolase [Patescibacteria group bacterium]|nr:M20/M25/M40 family metallo-hydrolase [Patescibacteria group bacterium]
MAVEKKIEAEILTKALIKQQSISKPGEAEYRIEETKLAEQINKWFEEKNVPSFLQELPDGRKNVFAFVAGKRDETIVIAGHFDTVDVKDYLRMKLHPFDSDTLAEEQEIDTERYVVGRGAFDMKSGIAVGMTLMNKWNENKDNLNGSVLFVATCDEENDSFGILNAADVLLAAKGSAIDDGKLTNQVKKLTGGRELNLQGVINMDYTTERFPGDKEYHVWSGTIGKLLPSIIVRGKETHVGEHFGGFHASSLMSRIVSEFEGNMEFAGNSVPPTVLKLSDGRDLYNVMTESTLRAYVNVFSVGQTPAEIIDKLKDKVTQVVGDYSESIKNNYGIYKNRMGLPNEVEIPDWGKRTKVMTYSELLGLANEKIGKSEVDNLIKKIASTVQGDGRDVSFAIVDALLTSSELKDPAVIIFYSPPYYPYIKPDNGKLYEATKAKSDEVGKEYGVSITMHHFYPYISDMSYLKLEPEISSSINKLTGEMPVWGVENENGKKVYHVDLDKVAKLGLPVVNVGPYGHGAHKTEERVEKKYSFEILPDLVDRIVNNIFNDDKTPSL